MHSRALCLTLALTIAAPAAAAPAARVSGELKKWHRVTLTFDGPRTGETATPNPFRDYRLIVTFAKGTRRITVPGYFAADGRAAQTGATEGTAWRAHFAPDDEGEWTYTASFRTGTDVAVSDDDGAGRAVSFDGATGSFTVGPTDKTAPDLRAKGRLDYVGGRYLRFQQTGDYFVKCGADAPENFLAYRDFDGAFKNDGHKDNLVKTWSAHVRDWQAGDPTWQGTKGKGIIGAVNYLASEGLNAFSFLTLNIQGDDRNVFPYTTYRERYRMDCSRLDQWEIVLEHATRKGMYLHFKTLETENELILDGGNLGTQRKLYYRELIARFAHHLALNWNLGEEINNASTAQKKAWAKYFWDHDPYRHHIVIHNGANHYDLLGPGSKLTGFSLQTNRPNFSNVHRQTKNYLDRSAAAGKPWVVACDEPGDAQHALRPDNDAGSSHTDGRKNALWGNLMAGGAGLEFYFGYRHDHSDLTCQDWRSRDAFWDYCRYALQLFQQHLPFAEMRSADALVDARGTYCFAKPGYVYAIYLPRGGTAKLNLGKVTAEYGVRWYDPRKGGPLQKGSLPTIKGPGAVAVGRPPRDPGKDWAVLVKLPDGVTVDPKDLPDLTAAAPRRPEPGGGKGAIVGFTLINADTNQPIGPLKDGATLRLSKLPTRRLSVRADTSRAPVDAVRFALDGNRHFRTERTAPYALTGDTNGRYNPWTPRPGRHTLTATPLVGGKPGRPLTIRFTIVGR